MKPSKVSAACLSMARRVLSSKMTPLMEKSAAIMSAASGPSGIPSMVEAKGCAKSSAVASTASIRSWSSTGTRMDFTGVLLG